MVFRVPAFLNQKLHRSIGPGQTWSRGFFVGAAALQDSTEFTPQFDPQGAFKWGQTEPSRSGCGSTRRPGPARRRGESFPQGRRLAPVELGRAGVKVGAVSLEWPEAESSVRRWSSAIAHLVKSAELFVGVLGASSYTYAEVTWSQALPDWVGERRHHAPPRRQPPGPLSLDRTAGDAALAGGALGVCRVESGQDQSRLSR